MAVIMPNKVQYVQGPPPVGDIPTANRHVQPSGVNVSAVIDGTPIRICTIAIAAAAGLVALKWAGFRFNVGVS